MQKQLTRNFLLKYAGIAIAISVVLVLLKPAIFSVGYASGYVLGTTIAMMLFGALISWIGGGLFKRSYTVWFQAGFWVIAVSNLIASLPAA